MSLKTFFSDILRPSRRQEKADAQTKSRRTPEQIAEIRGAMRDAIVNAKYDSTQKTLENERHWQWADHLAADSSLNPWVRERLRTQSRYELQENNSYGHGIAQTVVTDTIGTGPRLQVTEFSKSENQQIEQAWQRWTAATGFNDNLVTTRLARLIDGETVNRFINNLTVDDPVQLDLQLIECDQLRSPQFELQLSETYVDGVHLDRFGNPYAYDILKRHPGAMYWTSVDMWAYDTYNYDQVIHSFRKNRPGQHRGVPEFAPALPLFAFLRRFTLATVAAAETAASVSQVVQTDAPIPEELEDEYTVNTFEKWMDAIPIERNSATVLPNQWKLMQFAAEHPTTTFAMFKREIVAEIARSICVPVNVGMLDSGNSNFSSAKFDWLGYERKVRCDQDSIARNEVDRVFAEWIVEASLLGVISTRPANKVLRLFDQYGRRGIASQIQHAWYWDGMRSADENDAANAQQTRLQNGTTHRAMEYQLQGKDIDVEDEKAAEGFGMTVQEYRQRVAASIFSNGNITDMNPEEGNGDSSQESQSSSPAQAVAATL